MKQTNILDPPDSLISHIFTHKCTEFFHKIKHKQVIQINEALEFTANQPKLSHTFQNNNNKIVCSSLIARSALREVALEQTEELKKKEEELLTELMKHIVENIKYRIDEIFLRLINPLTNKEGFKLVTFTLQEEFESVNDELSRMRKYTKRKDIRDLSNLLRDMMKLEISSISSTEFVELVLVSIPNLKDYFVAFQLEVFNNQEIEQIRQDIEIMDDLVSFEELIEKRAQEKRYKRKQKKKKNKINMETADNTSHEDSLYKENIGNENDYETEKCQNIIEFLESMKIRSDRQHCLAPDEWLLELKCRYVL